VSVVVGGGSWEAIGPWNSGQNNLPADGIASLSADQAGSIWLAVSDPLTSAGRGIAHVLNGQWHTYSDLDNLPEGAIGVILGTGDGSLLVGTTSVAGRWVPPNTWTDLGFDQQNNYALKWTALGAAGQYWYAGPYNVFRREPGGNWIDMLSVGSLNSFPILGMQGDDDGNVYVLDSYGIVRFDTDGSWERLVGAAYPIAMRLDRQQRLWFVDATGAVRYRDGEQWVSPAPGVSRYVAFMSPDYQGWMWGLDEDGARLTGFAEDGTTRDVSVDINPETTTVTAFEMDAGGTAWLGTASRGIIKVSDLLGEHPSTQTLRTDGCPYSEGSMVLGDLSGRLWVLVAGHDPLVRTPDGTWSAVPALRGRSVLSGAADADGAAWISVSDAVLKFPAGALTFTELATVDELRLLFIDASGVAWASPSNRYGVVVKVRQEQVPGLEEMYLPDSSGYESVEAAGESAGFRWLVSDRRILRQSGSGQWVEALDLTAPAPGESSSGQSYRTRFGSPFALCQDVDSTTWFVAESGVFTASAEGAVRAVDPLDVGTLDPATHGFRGLACGLDGQVWFLQDTAATVRLPENRWERRPLANSAPFCSNPVVNRMNNPMALDSTGTVTVATNCGVMRTRDGKTSRPASLR
jgi:ligand-binding sensor domain-containing protein